ncbi:DUF1800 domain-containing protein [Pedobacter sp. MC2016-14]|uniref:DUF1800 domain-containing protein n=1 Tax=Pedobacter sp. MC2016-14 TaxID=2897327 RepID=UPI001E62DE9E|nr:DUF1800 domain-containing protein [Pedobacter sp. MC2016-14]MCD0489760.1 DUF1800 domain-containing protein [Pedobacter sp. MC2016-14]
MKTTFRLPLFFLIIMIGIILICSSFLTERAAYVKFSFPYKKSGLTERQAAAHLLSRFTYGVRPGDIDRVVKLGLEKWFQQQLDAKLKDDTLNTMLEGFDAINLSNTEVANIYPRGGQALKMAIKDGFINKDSIDKTEPKEYRAQVAAYMKEKGLRPEQELIRQFINQKILRASFSNNQLQELLTDFWFNHFNVSLTKNQCAPYIPAYERDVIRPNVTGKFENLLLATAKSPAMLLYLDNYTSTGSPTPANGKRQTSKKSGLNENYAREVMELHTLGVDGGYTQNDVTEAAKVLTGWTLYPAGQFGYGLALKGQLEKLGEAKMEERGYVHEGDFLFVPTRHDDSNKQVLNTKFNGSGGYQEGMQLFNLLANHPATANFITRKLAIRFVSDQPAPALLDKMEKTFIKTSGDIKQVMITMASAPEFWSSESLREKTKSPFELAISAVRSLDADIRQPYQLYNWINKMGQKMYAYQAPTGFPDRGQYWINTGSLLNRMNFGLALADQRIPGIKVNLAALNNNHEPESSEAALSVYGKIILPERNLTETIKRLKPLLNDPNLKEKVNDAAAKISTPATGMDAEMNSIAKEQPELRVVKAKPVKPAFDNKMLAQVVGVIIGSPEFQRK